MTRVGDPLYDHLSDSELCAMLASSPHSTEAIMRRALTHTGNRLYFNGIVIQDQARQLRRLRLACIAQATALALVIGWATL